MHQARGFSLHGPIILEVYIIPDEASLSTSRVRAYQPVRTLLKS